MKKAQQIRVLIADDDFLVGETIRRLLKRAGYDVVGKAGDGEQALKMTQALQPDVVLMDIEMPGLGGIEATRQIQAHSPTPVVILTAYESSSLVEQAGAVGAGAYLVKPPNTSRMEQAITIAIARFQDMQELRRLNRELQAALAKVETLAGLLPICSYCRKVRDDAGYWQQVETYMSEHSGVTFTHGICPTCLEDLKQAYPELAGETP